MSFDSSAAIAATLMLRFMAGKRKLGLHRRKKKINIYGKHYYDRA